MLSDRSWSNTPRHFEEGAGHEPNQIEVKGILFFAVALVAIGVTVLSVLGLVMGSYKRQSIRDWRGRPPMLTIRAEPPAPHLQSDPALELRQLKEKEMEQLTTYGWIDQAHDIAHIPIDRCIEILVRKGLPDVPATPRPDSEPALGPVGAEDPKRKAETSPNAGREPRG
jgi:hypothetical protein